MRLFLPKGRLAGKLELLADLFEFFRGGFNDPVFGPGLVEREQVDVGVGYVFANDFPDDSCSEFLVHVLSDFFGGFHEGLEIILWQIVNLFDFNLWNYQDMTSGLRVNIQKRKRFVVFVYFVAGNLPIDDFSKNTTHFLAFFL